MIKKCSRCGFVYLENCPPYEALSVEYAWEKTSHLEKVQRTTREPNKQVASNALKHFRRRILKRRKLGTLIERYFLPGKVLDIGCAGGGTLNSLDTKFTPYGVEISEELAHKAMLAVQRRGGEVVHTDAISGVRQFDANTFSGIIMSAFLEHEMEPKTLLQEACRVSATKGRVIIKVPNYACLNRVVRGSRWCGFRYPDHLNYFTPASLATMCRDCGFNIRQFGFFDRHPLSDNMWIVLEKND